MVGIWERYLQKKRCFIICSLIDPVNRSVSNPVF